MKTKKLLLLAMAVMAFVACQKDDGGLLRLSVEGMDGGTKMAVENNVAYWVTGDQVRINGQTLTVSVNENAATVNSTNGFVAPYYGVYPAGIYDSNSDTSYTLNIPYTYIYTTTTRNNSTLQDLQAPMVAYAEDGTDLLFKHLTAAINVRVVNDFGIDVCVTNVTVSSNKYKLNGATTVIMGSDITVDPVAAEGDGNASLRQVQMTFSGVHQLIIPSGSSAVVQVPVLPVGNDNRFTVSVTVQNKDDAAMTYTFSKTQAGNSADGYALGRAQLGYAPAKFGGVFTVGSGKQVRFAPGNLQYLASENKWRFAQHQYDVIGSAPGNTTTSGRETQTNWIDLFGWGTSGQFNGYMPYDYKNVSPGYGPKATNLTLENKADWGINAINNGGNEDSCWRTLTKEEVEYLLATRTCSMIGNKSNCRYVKAEVCGVQGLIVFPDEYTHPTGVSVPDGINVGTTSAWSNSKNKYNDADSWNKLEVAGAIFLPLAGVRSDTTVTTSYGYYWTSKYYFKGTNYSAYYLYFDSSSLDYSNYQPRYLGCAVRLVRDVQ